MSEDEGARINPSELRRRAEEKLARGDGEDVLEESAERTLHELRVHQIELEMQNDELRRAQAELEKSRSRYFDLYDLAPVGFYSLDEAGVIEDSNLAFEAMLDLTRGEATRRKLSQYIHRDDQDVYYLHHKRLVENGRDADF
jgi:PAS domain-containing protein